MVERLHDFFYCKGGGGCFDDCGGDGGGGWREKGRGGVTNERTGN